MPNSRKHCEATIALILKKYRDSMEMSSYRPVSLLPIENKGLTKILANRLKKYISDIIHLTRQVLSPSLRQELLPLPQLYDHDTLR